MDPQWASVGACYMYSSGDGNLISQKISQFIAKINYAKTKKTPHTKYGCFKLTRKLIAGWSKFDRTVKILYILFKKLFDRFF